MIRRLALTVLAALAATAAPAWAADLRVLTAGAFKQVLVAAQPEFERRTGHRLLIDNDTAGALQRRITAGEAFDLVVSSPASLQPLRQAGKLAEEAPPPLARVGIGVAVKPGTPVPPLASVDDFRRLLLQARSVAMIDPAAGGSSGIYLAQLFEQWGIAPQVKAKAVLVPGGLVAERVMNGQAEVAVHQISEILAVPGAVLVGPLPAEIQNYTVYAGAIGAQARDPAAARQLLDTLRGPGLAGLLQAKGMEPVH
ncbi:MULTISPECIES: molybdate ABC transporter substrate-binding protein [Ramlibacter]|nr:MULTISPECIES: substrate-binding domain-containing protein [Ramlibacter]MBA2962039.1 substrate-binding domain-containing protein [Ramlibacter sp. CGMCC 1.13660]